MSILSRISAYRPITQEACTRYASALSQVARSIDVRIYWIAGGLLTAAILITTAVKLTRKSPDRKLAPSESSKSQPQPNLLPDLKQQIQKLEQGLASQGQQNQHLTTRITELTQQQARRRRSRKKIRR